MFASRLPWSIARSNGNFRRVLALIVIGALLYGIGVQVARACLPAVLQSHLHVAVTVDGEPDPCHGDAGITRAVCEAHCRGEAQSTRASLNFDLPAAPPLDVVGPVEPVIVFAHNESDTPPPPRDNGPPLHLLFHRFLR